MKSVFVVIAMLGLLGGCGVADFAARQNQWNQQNGMSSMNPRPVMTGGSSDADEQTQRNIRQGEDVENQEAAKAGFGPSPTAGMNCATNSGSSGSANNMSTSSHTSCHN